MRYWYIDSANFVTLMLIDKGYYDYDYEAPSEKVKAMKAVKNDDDLKAMLNSMGIKSKKQAEAEANASGVGMAQAATNLQQMDMEQLQAYAMADASEGGGTAR